MRSNSYTTKVNNKIIDIPVLAVGKPNNPDIISGTNYNFRLYQDGSINIGNGEFIATSTGSVTANNITIHNGNITIKNGNIAGLKINNSSLKENDGRY